MKIARVDLFGRKNSRFDEEFQLIDEDGAVISLVGKRVRLIVKESEATSVELFNLLLDITDEANGMFACHICKEDMDVEPDYTVYHIYVEDIADPDCETDEVLYGTFKFGEGI